jgi:hypothetical protein
MIRSVHINSCLAAQIRFLLFKGPRSFKTIFKIGGNVDELKAYRLIPLTPPHLFHLTLPLSSLLDSIFNDLCLYKYPLSSYITSYVTKNVMNITRLSLLGLGCKIKRKKESYIPAEYVRSVNQEAEVGERSD